MCKDNTYYVRYQIFHLLVLHHKKANLLILKYILLFWRLKCNILIGWLHVFMVTYIRLCYCRDIVIVPYRFLLSSPYQGWEQRDITNINHLFFSRSLDFRQSSCIHSISFLLNSSRKNVTLLYSYRALILMYLRK